MRNKKKYAKYFLLLRTLAQGFFIFSFLLFIHSCTQNKTAEQNPKIDSTLTLLTKDGLWKAPDTLMIPDNDSGNLISYGRSLIANTSEYLGPKGSVAHITNGMNCQNCHLDAGTKYLANNFSAVASLYPRFRARSGGLESIEKRVNDCLERSMNGKPIDSTSKEMSAFVAYLQWVGHNVKKGVSPKGAGVVELPLLDRAADPVKGKKIFQQKCLTCHGADGQGKLNPDLVTYQYPPLWGNHSYNTGAGLFRLSRFAGYVKNNMPFITTPENPPLTNEEAWDVAAFVNSRQRTMKVFTGDWPDISKKPFDHPFGPYADQFTESQHKFGPYTAMSSVYRKK